MRKIKAIIYSVTPLFAIICGLLYLFAIPALIMSLGNHFSIEAIIILPYEGVLSLWLGIHLAIVGVWSVGYLLWGWFNERYWKYLDRWSD